MIYLILFSEILTGSFDHNQDKIAFDITLMYRKSGESALTFEKVHSGDTLDYYKRGFNPYFRVYSFFKLPSESLELKSVIIDSYLNSQLLKSTTPNYSSNKWQFVDTYIDANEDLVRVRISYSTKDSNVEKEFAFFIKQTIGLY